MATTSIRRWAAIGVLVGWTVAFWFDGTAQAERPRILLDGHAAHPDRLLAKLLRPGSAAWRQDAEELLRKLGWTRRREFRMVPGLWSLETRPAGAEAAAGGEVPYRSPLSNRPGGARDAELRETIGALRLSGLFAYVEPDYYWKASLAPDDALYLNGRLWALNNLDVAGMDIDPEPAWDVTVGSPDVIVGVLDTGVRYTHEEMEGQMWENPGEIPNDGRDNDLNGYDDDVHGIDAILNNGDPLDDQGHGSHVAGIIAAKPNGGGPVVGVAWNVKIMALKVLDAEGYGVNSDIIKAFEYGVEHGCRVLNASLGGSSRSQAIFDLIAEADRRNVLLVAAAGNEGLNNDVNVHYPSGYELPNVISVAGIDNFGRLATWSNYGVISVDIAAPGTSVYSLGYEDDQDYFISDGTSQAAPYVAGVAALIASEFADATPLEIRERILISAIEMDTLFGKVVSRGRLSASGALNVEGDGILELRVDPPSLSALPVGTVLPVTVRVSDIIGVKSAKVEGTLPDGSALAFGNLGRAPDVLAGDALYTAELTLPSEPGEYVFEVAATAPSKEPVREEVVYRLVVAAPNDDFADALKLPPEGTGDPFVEVSVLHASVECRDSAGDPCECPVDDGSEDEEEDNGPREPGEGEEPEEEEPEVDCRRVEPLHHGLPLSDHSLWWTWTAPEDSKVLLSTIGSDYDTVLAVYTGNELTELERVASIDDVDAEPQAYLFFEAVRGVTYRIAVASESPGDIGTLRFRLTPGGSLDRNEPVVVVAEPPSGIRSFEPQLRLAGTAFDPVPSASGVAAVWIRLNRQLIPTRAAGTTDWEATIPLIEGENDIEVTAVDYGGNLSDPVSLKATYLVQVPVNDHFYRARILEGTSGQMSWDNRLATKQTDEPFHADSEGGHSLWYAFIPTESGLLKIWTAGADFDSVMGLYSGEPQDGIGDLTPVAHNDDASVEVRNSRIEQAVSPDLVYWIAIDGLSGQSGQGELLYEFSGGQVHAVTVESGAGGQVSPAAGQYVRGSELVLQAMPDETYRFVAWEGDLDSRQNPLAIEIVRDLRLRAVFAKAVSDDFESGSLDPAAYGSEGEPWRLVDWRELGEAPSAELGNFSLRAGDIGHGESSELRYQTNGEGGPASFYYRINCEEGWDFLEFYVNDRREFRLSGKLSWRKYEFELPAGRALLRWVYVKDDANSVGEDTAYLDNFALQPPEPQSRFQYRLQTGAPGQRVRIESSDNLRNWVFFALRTADRDGFVDIEDVIPVAGSQRFYRVVGP